MNRASRLQLRGAGAASSVPPKVDASPVVHDAQEAEPEEPVHHARFHVRQRSCVVEETLERLKKLL
eukprot:2500129-Prymnesium_polylepis.1